MVFVNSRGKKNRSIKGAGLPFVRSNVLFINFCYPFCTVIFCKNLIVLI